MACQMRNVWAQADIVHTVTVFPLSQLTGRTVIGATRSMRPAFVIGVKEETRVALRGRLHVFKFLGGYDRNIRICRLVLAACCNFR